MDPDVLYERIMTAVANLRADGRFTAKDGVVVSDDELTDMLITDLMDLDEWLRKGGFLPQAWQRPERPVVGKPMCTRCFRREGAFHAMWCGA